MKKVYMFLMSLLSLVLLLSTNKTSIFASTEESVGTSYTYYGYYPQSLLEDDIIYDALYFNSLENPADYLNWYMYAGEYYARVETSKIEGDVYFSNGTKILNNRVYFFKVEKIKWNLNKNPEYYALDSVKVLDGSSYYDIQEYETETFFRNSNIYSLIEEYITPSIEFNTKGLEAYTSNYSSIYRDSFEVYSLKAHISSFEQSIKDNVSLEKKATDYALARGAKPSKNGNTEYWQEMIGTNNYYAIYTSSTGRTLYNKNINVILGIAPCIRLKRGAI